MPAKRSAMRKIKEVLRLKFEARLSLERIAAASGVSKGAVSNYVQRAVQKSLIWPLPPGHAKRLEKQTREGNDGPLPALVPTDTTLAAQITAQRTHAAAAQMLKNLESSARESAAALAEAEQALNSAALAALGAEADARAARLETLRAQVEEEERILGAVRDLHFKIPGFYPSQAAFRALRDPFHLPVGERSRDPDWNTPVNERNAPPAQDHWTDRFAALLAGEDVEPSPTEAAA